MAKPVKKSIGMGSSYGDSSRPTSDRFAMTPEKEKEKAKAAKANADLNAAKIREAEIKKYQDSRKPLDRSKLPSATDFLSTPKEAPKTDAKKTALKRLFTGKGKLRGFGGPGFLRGMNK